MFLMPVLYRHFLYIPFWAFHCFPQCRCVIRLRGNRAAVRPTSSVIRLRANWAAVRQSMRARLRSPCTNCPASERASGKRGLMRSFPRLRRGCHRGRRCTQRLYNAAAIASRMVAGMTAERKARRFSVLAVGCRRNAHLFLKKFAESGLVGKMQFFRNLPDGYPVVVKHC